MANDMLCRLFAECFDHSDGETLTPNLPLVFDLHGLFSTPRSENVLLRSMKLFKITYK